MDIMPSISANVGLLIKKRKSHLKIGPNAEGSSWVWGIVGYFILCVFLYLISQNQENRHLSTILSHIFCELVIMAGNFVDMNTGKFKSHRIKPRHKLKIVHHLSTQIFVERVGWVSKSRNLHLLPDYILSEVVPMFISSVSERARFLVLLHYKVIFPSIGLISKKP